MIPPPERSQFGRYNTVGSVWETDQRAGVGRGRGGGLQKLQGMGQGTIQQNLPIIFHAP